MGTSNFKRPNASKYFVVLQDYEDKQQVCKDCENVSYEDTAICEARHKVINFYDLSFNPYIFKVLELSDDKFTVCAKGIDFLRLKKHFKFAYSGNNTATFRK